MFWSNVKLIFLRELRDQLRDRRTLFAVVVLPLLLYPLLGMLIFQVQQFLKEHTSRIRIVTASELPDQPRLLDGGKLAAEFGDSRQLDIEVVPSSSKPFEEIRSQSQTDIQLGLCDAVVYFPPDFAQQLARIRAGNDQRVDGRDDNRPDPSPETQIIFDAARDKSRVAKLRIETVLLHWRNSLGESNLQASNVSAVAARPFDVKQTDVAPEVRRRVALWSKILPFILMIWALTGAFYPAVDLCAGEKERGTLETLLTSPAARQEIVCGKLLTVMTFSIATAVLNLASMMATGAFIFSQIQRMGAVRLLDVSAPPISALLCLLLALLPISALFSALALAIAAFARSSKEGHYYLVPMLMLSLPLMMLSIVPGAELDLGFSLIPLTGLLLWLRAFIEGQYFDVLRFSVPVLGMTAVCCFFAIRWAVSQFNNESVLFRESERFDLVLWLRHLRRNRTALPTAGQAVLLALLILLARFTFSLAAPQPTSWTILAMTTLIMLLAFVAAPACLMAIFFTRRPAQALLLRAPTFTATIPVGALLAASLHPLLLWLNQGIAWLYPLNPLAAAKLGEIESMFLAAPIWQALAVICLAPALCEELAFRGFILSGLRRAGRDWTAILITSAVFGLAHGILQQSLGAAVIGLVIGFIAVKSGSLWPGVAYHAAHNGLSVCIGRLTLESIDSNAILRQLFDSTPDGQILYRWPAALIAAAVALTLLWWLKSLPSSASSEIPAQSWVPTTWYDRPVPSRLEHQHDAA